MDKEDIKIKKDQLTTKIFWLSFQTIFIFGVPAFLGLYLGKTADSFFRTGKIITLITIVFTFILSWAIVIFKYRKIKKQLSELKMHE